MSVFKATDAATARTAIGAGTSSFSGAYGDLSGKPSNATTSVYGFMSSADKTKLDGLNGANYAPVASVGKLTANSQSANYTLALSDAGSMVHLSAAYTVTVPANSSVAFPVGTVITIVADAGALSVTSTDTLRLAATTTTGTRTIAAYGHATLIKVATTEWRVAGAGVS